MKSHSKWTLSFDMFFVGTQNFASLQFREKRTLKRNLEYFKTKSVSIKRALGFCFLYPETLQGATRRGKKSAGRSRVAPANTDYFP